MSDTKVNIFLIADSLRNDGSKIGKLNLAAYSSPGKLNPPPSRPGPSSASPSGRGPSYIGFNQEGMFISFI